MFKSEKGFAIAQVMIAAAMMSVLGLGLSTMIQNQSKSVFYLEDQLSHQNMKKEFENLLFDNAICTSSLNGVVIPAVLTSVNSAAGTNFNVRNVTGILFSAADPAHNSFDNLLIKRMRVQNIDIAAAAAVGNVNIEIQIERKRSSSKQQLKNINIVQRVNIDASRQVVSCVGGSGFGPLGSTIEGVQSIVSNSSVMISGNWSLANVLGTYVDSDASSLSGVIWKDASGQVSASLAGATQFAVTGVVRPGNPVCMQDPAWPDYRVCVRRNPAGQVFFESAAFASGNIIKYK